ncbi:hypothetical protein [Nitrososphaera sp.]|uniref:HFX_2341 family transcriptional regulator domain-containing protein n=1 Tax=Nitrososphaera sp. TaxID=1971748 RepID=UPI00307D37C1
MTQLKTIQIATFGADDAEGIASGIRNFPVHKLALICYAADKQKADEFARKISTAIGIRAAVNVVNRENVIRDTMERVSEILNREGRDYEQVLMNVSSGDKLMGCAALSSAFVNGIKTFGMDEAGMPMLLPVLKLSYSEIISEAKLKILKCINDQGGSVESFEHLEQVSGYGKPLLSYHVMGSKEAKGLVELGLLEVEKGERGRIASKLTTLGKLLVISNSALTSTTTGT